MRHSVKAVRSHIIVQMFLDLVGKLKQNPDIYPIRYYKKGRRIRKNWASH